MLLIQFTDGRRMCREQLMCSGDATLPRERVAGPEEFVSREHGARNRLRHTHAAARGAARCGARDTAFWLERYSPSRTSVTAQMHETSQVTRIGNTSSFYSVGCPVRRRFGQSVWLRNIKPLCRPCTAPRPKRPLVPHPLVQHRKHRQGAGQVWHYATNCEK
jgi:hypothetical protein